MAVVTVIQIRGNLTEMPNAVGTGDTVVNETQGTLNLVLTEDVTIGTATVRQRTDAEVIEVLPGATSSAITVAAGEVVMALNVNGGVVTADKLG